MILAQIQQPFVPPQINGWQALVMVMPGLLAFAASALAVYHSVALRREVNHRLTELVDETARSNRAEGIIQGGESEMQRAIIARKDAFSESYPDACLTSDELGTVIMFNHQAELMFGYSREQVIGKKVEMLIPSSLRDAHRNHRLDYERNPHVRDMGADISIKALHRSGQTFAVKIRLSPVMAPGIGMHVIAVIRQVGQLSDAVEMMAKAASDARNIIDVAAKDAREVLSTAADVANDKIDNI